ncbi:hypothetical protein HanIR_Chr08g0386851 [Helianthus annuus]|nr:hypothetical protein HanIR_Chr08g0386851 [Helianthus annuus]
MAPSSANHGNSMMSSVVNQGSVSMNTLGSSRSMHTDGGQRMMPTPGFNNSTSNQSYVKLESSNNVSGISSVDSTMVSQPLQQKHMGGGIRSTLTQKSYGSSNGNLGMMGNSFGNSEGFLTDPHYGNSPKPVPQYFDQQGHISQGEGSGNLFIPTTSGTSPMNTNSVNLSTLQRTSYPSWSSSHTCTILVGLQA